MIQFLVHVYIPTARIQFFFNYSRNYSDRSIEKSVISTYDFLKTTPLSVSVVGWRAEGPSGFSTPGKGGPSLLLLLFFFTGWAVGEDGDGCSRWSVAGGNGGELVWVQGRLFQLWQCVRDQTEQIVKIGPPPPPPLHILFLFCFF